MSKLIGTCNLCCGHSMVVYPASYVGNPAMISSRGCTAEMLCRFCCVNQGIALPEVKKAKKPNKGLSKSRRGFPVPLSKEHHLMLHITYAWMQKHGETTPEIDDLMKTLPPYEEPKVAHGYPGVHANWRDRHASRVLRVRATEVPSLIKLFERAQMLPFHSSSTFKNRVRDLKALGTMDLMVDAQRE